MKRTMWWALAPVVAALTAGMVSCGGRGNAGGAADVSAESAGGAVVFLTDSVGCSDSLMLGGCRATVKISGLYPDDGETACTDSARAWVATRLSFASGSSGVPLFVPTAAEIADGQTLANATASALMAMARGDFEDFERDSIRVSYEFECRFRPVFVSDSLLTYSYSGYVYLGGAHGGAAGLGQTFNRMSGEALTFANSIEPSATDDLRAMIRRALWTQYFTTETDGEGALTLRDVLLIDPDTLPLPSSAPEFMADGVHVTYQQYEIACYAAGMPSVVLPYDSVAPLMRPAIVRLLPR